MKSDRKMINGKKDKKVRQPVAEIKKLIRPSRSINSVYVKIKSVLEEARNNAFRAVNFVMVQAYWHIGQLIVEEEQKGFKRAGYGQHLLKTLSEKLTLEFGSGFSEQNLRSFRQFYLVFIKRSAVQSTFRKKGSIIDGIRSAVRSELSWTHYKLLMRVDDPKARNWYMSEAADCNWSTRQLERQINSFFNWTTQ